MSTTTMERDLHEQRLRAWEQAKAVVDAAEAEGRDLSAEENETFTRASADMDNLDARIKRIGTVRAHEDLINEFRDSYEVAGEQAGGEARSEWQRFISGETRTFTSNLSEARALATASSPAVKQDVISGALWVHLLATSPILDICTVINTSKGNPIPVPTTTGDPTAALVTEGSAITASDSSLTTRTLNSYDYKSLSYVSTQLIQDEAFDVAGLIAKQAGREVGLSLGAHLTKGTGSSQPAGAVTGASAGVTGATSVSGAFTADNLIDLFYAVAAPYRKSPSAAWLMSDASIAAARKLKASGSGEYVSEYLFTPAQTVNDVDRLLGRPVYSDVNMADPATSAKSVLFGDFSAYFARVVDGVRFERSDDYRFNTDEVAFRTVLSADGILVDQTGAVKYFVGGAS